MLNQIPSFSCTYKKSRLWATCLGLALLAPGCAQSTGGSHDPAPKVEASEQIAGDRAPPAAPVVEPPAKEQPPPVEKKKAWEPREADRVTPHQALENPEALAAFYDRLAVIDDAAANGEKDAGLARVVHLGASMIGSDDLTSVLREKFQTRFGDGGAGLVLMARYMSNYIHRWVKLNASGWGDCYIAYLCLKDGHYGLGGAAFWPSGSRATTKISTRKHELGDEVSKFEVWYADTPHGGKIDIRVDGGEKTVLDTKADTLTDRYHALDVEQGAHTIEVTARGGKRTRAYGVVLETDGPGIVWDQFSMLGAFTKRLHGYNPEHIKGQIAHRDPDLIAFTYGGNDLRRVANKKLTKEKYTEEYLTGIRRVQAGKPEASCLVIGITDRGKSLTFTILPEHVQTIVDGQREAAKQAGCAFFDTYTAMGGPGSLKAWMKKRPPLAAKDLKHLNHAGREIFGGWLYDAIVAGYVAHRTAKNPA
ncbi:MAG: GDSL-type esterase/lipase family protein [Nannocystaceae bacterium]